MKKIMSIIGVLLFISPSYSQEKGLQEVPVQGSLAQLQNNALRIKNMRHVVSFDIKMEIIHTSNGPSIKLLVPSNSCDFLPAYFVKQFSKLYFFEDESDRRITFDMACSKYNITYILTADDLQDAIPGRQHAGLEIPLRIMHSRAFSADQSVNQILKVKPPGGHTITIENKKATLYREIEQGQYWISHPIQTLLIP